MNDPGPELARFELVVILLGWIILGAIMVARKRAPQRGGARAKSGASIVGIAVQGASYAVIWSARRPFLTPLARGGVLIQAALALATLSCVCGALWLMYASMQTLGKQWSLQARVASEHELITGGPYAVVRHPIYLAMFLMLLATGIAVSRWPTLGVAILVFGVGTAMRVRSEERLLRAAFGAAFENYARRVPAYIPWTRW